MYTEFETSKLPLNLIAEEFKKYLKENSEFEKDLNRLFEKAEKENTKHGIRGNKIEIANAILKNIEKGQYQDSFGDNSFKEEKIKTDEYITPLKLALQRFQKDHKMVSILLYLLKSLKPESFHRKDKDAIFKVVECELYNATKKKQIQLDLKGCEEIIASFKEIFLDKERQNTDPNIGPIPYTMNVLADFIHLQISIDTKFGERFAEDEKTEIINSDILNILDYLILFVPALNVSTDEKKKYEENRARLEYENNSSEIYNTLSKLFQESKKNQKASKLNIIENFVKEAFQILLGKDQSQKTKKETYQKKDSSSEYNELSEIEASRVWDELHKIYRSFEYLDNCKNDHIKRAQYIQKLNHLVFKKLLESIRDGYETYHKVLHSIGTARLLTKWRIGGDIIPVALIHHFQEVIFQRVCGRFGDGHIIPPEYLAIVNRSEFFTEKEDERTIENEYAYKTLSALAKFRYEFKQVQDITTKFFKVSPHNQHKCENLLHNAYEIMSNNFDIFFIILASHINRLEEVEKEIQTGNLSEDKKIKKLKNQIYARKILKFFSPITHFINQRDIIIASEDIPYKIIREDTEITSSGGKEMQQKKNSSQPQNTSEEKTNDLEKIIGLIKNTLREKRALYSNSFEDLEITGRTKHRYSRSKKTFRKGEIKDELGIRIVVTDNKTPDCYNIIDVLKSSDRLEIVPDLFDDYIKEPKPGGYQSIHQIFNYLNRDKKPTDIYFEVQVRTREMDIAAGRGEASHWNYKLASDIEELSSRYVEKSWLIRWSEFFTGNVIAFKPMIKSINGEIDAKTPERRVVILPLGSVPLDLFGFYLAEEEKLRKIDRVKNIVSEIAKMQSFKNGKSLDACSYLIQNGDEITFKKQKNSSKDDKKETMDSVQRWLGYVMSNHLRKEMCIYIRKHIEEKEKAREEKEGIEKNEEYLKKRDRKIHQLYEEQIRGIGQSILDTILRDKRITPKTFFFKSVPGRDVKIKELIRDEYEDMPKQLIDQFPYERIISQNDIFISICEKGMAYTDILVENTIKAITKYDRYVFEGQNFVRRKIEEDYIESENIWQFLSFGKTKFFCLKGSECESYFEREDYYKIGKDLLDPITVEKALETYQVKMKKMKNGIEECKNESCHFCKTLFNNNKNKKDFDATEEWIDKIKVRSEGLKSNISLNDLGIRVDPGLENRFENSEIRLCKFCRPIAESKIFIELYTQKNPKGRKGKEQTIILHSNDCPKKNWLLEKDKQPLKNKNTVNGESKKISLYGPPQLVEWKKPPAKNMDINYATTLRILAMDRVGMVSDLTGQFKKLKLNLKGVSSEILTITTDVHLNTYISNISKLNEIIETINKNIVGPRQRREIFYIDKEPGAILTRLK